MNNCTITLKQTPVWWFDGFPVGTGRLADMVLSYPDSDMLTLNHEALWKQLGKDRNCSDFTEFLPELRRLIHEHKSNEAMAFFDSNSHTENALKNKRYGHFVNSYVPAGEIELKYSAPAANPDFERSLDMKDGYAVCRSSGITRRFSGNPVKDLLEGEITSETAFAADLTLTRRGTRVDRDDSPAVYSFKDGLMKLTGSIPGPVFYCITLRFAGNPEIEFSEIENGVHLMNVRHLAVRCNIGCANTPEEAEKEAELPSFTAGDFTQDSGKRDQDYREFFAKLADLELPSEDKAVQYFNMAKHLLLNGSRTGTYPLNLQGKWNKAPNPLWDADYHLDINLEMCYWPQLAFGMDRANEAFLIFLKRMIPGGREGAKRMFGCRGIWLPYTADPMFRPYGGGIWGISAGAIPWLATHFFMHYLYTQDLDFLRKHGFPFMRESIQFLEDFITYREDGTACISPSFSPENTYIGAEKYPAALCENATMDVEVFGELFDYGITASELLNEDPEERARWKKMRAALPPLKVGKDGRLMEWEDEQVEWEPGHRHISHLYGVWPGNSITHERTPEFFEAARKSMAFRRKSFSWRPGWSVAWSANFEAMFGNGNCALEELVNLVEEHSSVSQLDLHPMDMDDPVVMEDVEGKNIFQIEGNIGAASAVFNMLLQNTPDYGVRLLPALPDKWSKEGRISNLHAYGGLIFDFAWKNGSITDLTIRSAKERKLQLICHGRTCELNLHPGENKPVLTH